MRVLVTEDDEVLARAVAAGLRREGMAVDIALDGDSALERLAVNRYDVVVLDRDLPGCTATTSAGPWPRTDPRAGC
jgi:DNA-binding response OmpR family regulator